MGGGTSKFEVTDWTRASGGLHSTEDTIDGAPPTREFQLLHLVKRSLTNQREFDVIDPTNVISTVLYTTRAVPGTLAWFDVLGPKPRCGNTSHPVLLLRVQVDLPRRTWTVYRYHEAVFPGQRPASLEPRLYKTACITVSWSRYVVVAARYGVPSIEYLSRLEPEGMDGGDGLEGIHNATQNDDEDDDDDYSETDMNDYSVSELNDSSIFRKQGDDDNKTRSDLIRTMSSDSNDELLEAAEKVAARRRESSNLYLDDATNSIALPSIQTQQSDDDYDGCSKSSKAKKILSTAVNACNCTTKGIDGMDSPESTLHHPALFDQKVAEAMLAAKRTDPLGNPLDPATYASMAPSSLTQYVSSRLFGSSDATSSKQQSRRPLANREERRKEVYRLAMEGVINLEGPLVECQEIYNKLIGNHQTSLIGKDQVRRLLHWDQAEHARTAHLKASDESNPFVLAVQQDERCQQEQSYTTAADDFITRVGQSMTGMGLTCDGDVRLTLDSPVPSPARSHQASIEPHTPSHYNQKNEFEASLANIVKKKQHQQTWAWWGASSSTATARKVKPVISSPSRSGKAAAAEVSQSLQKAAMDAALKDANYQVHHRAPELTPDITEQSSASTTGGEATPTTTNPELHDATITQREETIEESSHDGDHQQPLIGYWAWKNTYTVHMMELHIAKDADLALHVVLAIVCNQVRSERNALAMTV